MELSDEFGGIITYDDRLATRFSSSCWTPAPITDGGGAARSGARGGRAPILPA